MTERTDYDDFAAYSKAQSIATLITMAAAYATVAIPTAFYVPAFFATFILLIALTFFLLVTGIPFARAIANKRLPMAVSVFACYLGVASVCTLAFFRENLSSEPLAFGRVLVILFLPPAILHAVLATIIYRRITTD